MVQATTSALVGAQACAPTHIPKPVTADLSDAHVHLFNMADLPCGNFLQYVAIAQRFPNAPRWAKAIVDLVADGLKGMAPTARDELDGSVPSGAHPEVTPAAFGFRVADHMRRRMAMAAAAIEGSSDRELADSYRELNRAIAFDSSLNLAPSDEPDQRRIAEIAMKAEGGALQPGDVAARRATPNLLGFGWAEAAHLLGWVYIMLKSRRDHVGRYQRRFQANGPKPALLLNHLVDYDYWLGEGPAEGSDLLSQIEVMASVRDEAKGTADLRLYAGYCPLKHAIERLKPGPTTLERLLELHRTGKIHGFKLYPPMGFQPTGNSLLDDASFDPQEEGRLTALDAWKATGAPMKLGEAIDQALTLFYGEITSRKIPVMAHAACSNGAGPGYAARANPAFWADVTRTYPIRLTLGHLVDGVEAFVRAVENGPPYPPDVWSLQTATTLLDPTSTGAQVYGDLGYTEELLGNRALARRFFAAIRQAFGVKDSELTRVLYGTDWIMLGLERHDEQYLEAIIAGMHDAGLSATQQRNILSDNLHRALAP